MNNVKDILNKSYQRIGSTGGDIFHAQQLDGEFVICSNGARIKLTTLLSEFQIAGSVNENSQSQPFFMNQTESKIDPNNFFNTPAPIEAVPIVTTNSIRETPSAINGQVISPGANQNQNQQQPPPSFLNQNIEQPHSTGNVVEPQGQNPDTIQQQQSIRLPEWDMFDRIKKTEEVELNVTIKITLPKARHIDAINDMYQTKFSAYLAKQYLIDGSSMQTQLREAIEEWMDIELNGGKPKKKVASKTIKPKKGKKETLKATDALYLVEPQPMKSIQEAGSAALMFGQPAIEKDVTKLLAIYDNEQYIAAKQYFGTIDNKHKDYYRFLSMLELWEIEQKQKE